MKKFAFSLLLASQLLAAQSPAQDPFSALASFQYGKEESVKHLAARVNQPSAADRGALEEGLIGVITSTTATPEGKSFACRMLRQVGSDRCVAALAPLLLDEQLSELARIPLEAINSETSRAALRDALSKTEPKLQAGILNSLAACRDHEAVALIGKLASGSELSATAIRALGFIGDKKSADILLRLEPTESVRGEYLHALIDCAARVENGQALTLCEKVLASKDPYSQSAILLLLARIDSRQAATLAEQWLKGTDAVLCNGALSLLAAENTDGKVVEKIASNLEGLEPSTKARALVALGAGRHAQALSAVHKYLQDPDPAVSAAAHEAAGKIGNQQTIDLLLELKTPEAAAALSTMTGSFVEEHLISALADKNHRDNAAKALMARRSQSAVPTFIKALSEKDPEYRVLAWQALEVIAPADKTSELWRALQATTEAKEKKLAVKTLKAICSKAPDRKSVFDVLAAFYSEAPAEIKGTLLELASQAATPTALKLAAEGLDSGDPDLRSKAVRSLSDWTNVSAAPALLELAQNGRSNSERILALRGYIRLAGLELSKKHSGFEDWELSPEKQAAMFEKAAQIATRNEEKLLLLSSIKSASSEGVLPVLKLYLQDQNLTKDAETAAVTVVSNLTRSKKPEVRAMAEALAASSNESVSKQAKQLLDRLPR